MSLSNKDGIIEEDEDVEVEETGGEECSGDRLDDDDEEEEEGGGVDAEEEEGFEMWYLYDGADEDDEG